MSTTTDYIHEGRNPTVPPLIEARGPESPLYASEQIGLGGDRRPGDDERPLAAQAIDFGGKLRHRTFPENDALLREKREGAL